MAGELTILSREWEDEEKILTDFFIASHRAKLYSFSKHETDEKVQLVNYYHQQEERLIWEVFQKADFDSYILKYNHLEPEENNHYLKILPDGKRFYRIAMSDDAHDDQIIYDFAKEYLKLNPDKFLLEESSNTMISLDYLNSLESKGGYRKNWCYRILE